MNNDLILVYTGSFNGYWSILQVSTHTYMGKYRKLDVAQKRLKELLNEDTRG